MNIQLSKAMVLQEITKLQINLGQMPIFTDKLNIIAVLLRTRYLLPAPPHKKEAQNAL